MVKMGDTVRIGAFSANATDGVNIKACAYCDFAPICRSADKQHNTLLKKPNAAVIDILKRGEEDGI